MSGSRASRVEVVSYGSGWRLFLALLMALVLVPASQALGAQTIVSLTFDDATADQAPAQSILASHAMRATLYVPSGKIGSGSYYMTWQQVHDFASSGLGNEIGGHTVNHVDLTTLSTSQQVTEVCNDRQALIAQGFSPTSFAYPYAKSNVSAEQVVRDCGYTSGRGVGDVSCSGCVAAETIPPLNPFDLRTTPGVVSSTSVSTLQSYITRAESAGGGWVILVFHNICDGCNSNAITAANFTALLDWLQPRAANGTVVKTIDAVMNPAATGPDITPPSTSITCNGAACSSRWFNGAVSVALAASDSGSGVAVSCYTVDGSDPVASAGTCTNGTSYTAPFTISGTSTVRYRSYDRAGNVESVRSQDVAIDTAPPTDVAISSPANGTSLSYGSNVVTATASDTSSGVASVRFYVDGRLISTDTSAPYSTTWSTRRKDRGSRALYAEATDVAGNVTRSSVITVTVV